MEKTAQTLLIALQRGVPLTSRPWAEMARPLDMTEADVLRAGQDLFGRGVARRFGAVFDSRRLGYSSTLCAVDTTDGDIERAAALLHPHPGVTHCYEREGKPNLWFTLTAPSDRLDAELRRMGEMLKPLPLANLPAIRRFKVEVVLDAAAEDDAPGPAQPPPTAAEETAPPALSERQKSVIRRIQGNLPLVADPFGEVARELKWNPNELLQQLESWRTAGILRRVAFVLRHGAAGFVANGMCVWPVAQVDMARAGKILADFPEVTHCYERPSSASVPFNLYAMIHARERAAAEDTFRRMSERAGLSGGRMLISVHEFKKTSPVLFLEKDRIPEKSPL